MPVWVSSLPMWALVLLFVGTTTALSLGGLVLIRRFVIFRWRIDQDDSEFSGAMLQGILVFYGLAVALIAVNVWQSHTDVESTTSREAVTIAKLYRDVSLYPEPQRTQAQALLREYTQQVVDTAFPLAAKGEVSSKGTDLIDRFQSTVGAFEPTTEGQKIVHAEVLGRFNDLVDARRLRIDAIGTSLSGVMWGIVLAGAVFAVGASFFFQVEDLRLHATLVGLLALFVGCVLLLIASYERPFVGDLAVDAGSYRLVLDTVINR